MNRKPWPIIFVSLLFFIIPLLNITFNYAFLKDETTFLNYLDSLFNIPSNKWVLFDMVVPSIVAGIAVYCVKKWSYPVFLVCMLWITFDMVTNIPEHMTFSILLFAKLIPMLFNILYVSYLLIPEVRAAYYNPRLRWWETKPRYVYASEIGVTIDGIPYSAQMANISEGGIMAIMNAPEKTDSIMDLTLNVFEFTLDAKAKIVYSKPDGKSYGLQFVDLKGKQRKVLKALIKKLEKEKCEVTRQVPAWQSDLKKWFVTLIKTGKGFVPVIPSFNPAASSDKKQNS